MAQAPAAQAAQRVPDEEPVAQVASRVGPSVVQVDVEATQTTPFGTERQQGLGSGVIYREDGYVITNHHVVDGASEVSVAFADGTTEARRDRRQRPGERDSRPAGGPRWPAGGHV